MNTADLIDQYAAGPEKLSLGIRGLTREDLLTAPAADAGPELGKWSIQQVVMHMCDSEQCYADRMKRVIAEENPILQAYDENRWAENLRYEDQDAQRAIELINLLRMQMAVILRRTPESAFTRAGQHTERGKVTLQNLLETSVKHLEHHLRFIHAKRAAMGKEMW